jgi:hypothetical protein
MIITCPVSGECGIKKYFTTKDTKKHKEDYLEE